MAIINGTNRNDVLKGTNGPDTINGLGGHDILQGGTGADTLNGGDGYDTASYEDSGLGVSVTLATGYGFGGHAEGDILTSIEGLIGSKGNDFLFGNALYNEFYGNDGDDILDGGEGGDKLVGENGDDVLKGGGGNDVLIGDFGDDTSNGGDGADYFSGGFGEGDVATYAGASARVIVNLHSGGSEGEAAGDGYFDVEDVVGHSLQRYPRWEQRG